LKDEKKAITAVVNQVDKLKRLYDKAEAIRNATGAGNTDEATLEQQVLKACPVYDSLFFKQLTGPSPMSMPQQAIFQLKQRKSVRPNAVTRVLHKMKVQ